MTDDLAWRLGQRTPGHDYRIFRTAFVEGTHPSVAEPRRFSLIECVDWVNIIALTPRDEVVVIRQFRPGTGAVHIEIPGGMVDPGEAPDVAAARELAEETGYTSTRWRRLGKIAPNPAIQNNYLHCYLALDAEPTQPRQLESGEVLDLELMPLARVQAILREGTLDHALVIAAFGLLAFERGALGGPSQ